MKSRQTTVPCHSSRFFRRYARKWSWLSLHLTSKSTRYYPATTTQIVNFTPLKRLTLLLLTPSSNLWMLKNFLYFFLSASLFGHLLPSILFHACRITRGKVLQPPQSSRPCPLCLFIAADSNRRAWARIL